MRQKFLYHYPCVYGTVPQFFLNSQQKYRLIPLFSRPFYNLPNQIESERKDYYGQLEKQQRGTSEITGRLEWFLDCLGRAISSAEQTFV
jgi:hypothetical protein